MYLFGDVLTIHLCYFFHTQFFLLSYIFIMLMFLVIFCSDSVSSGGHGATRECPDGFIMIGLCASGRNEDCRSNNNDRSFVMHCCPETKTKTGISAFV